MESQTGRRIRWFDWSGDGRSVVYYPAKSVSGQRIVMKRLDDEHEETIWESSNKHKLVLKAFDVSPSGKTLAIARTLDGDNVIQTKPISGGPLREIARLRGTGTIHQSAGIYWSADGQSLYFGKSRPGGAGLQSAVLCRVAAAGGEPEELGLAIDKLFRFTVHPHEGRLVYSTGNLVKEMAVVRNLLSN